MLLQLGARHVAIVVPYAVAKYFDKLPDEGRHELLLNLADRRTRAGAVAYAVGKYFDKLPEDVRNELLRKLAGNIDAPSAVASALASPLIDNFEKLPAGVRKLLFKLADNLKLCSRL